MWTGIWSVVENSVARFNFFGAQSGLENIITGVIVIFIFLWIISIISVAKDIASKTNSHALQIISILMITILTPVLWLPLYLAIRPVSLKKDKIPRREACATNLIVCENCKQLNPKEYKCCIGCGEQLTVKCKECHKDYPSEYLYCHHCGAPNIENS